MSIKLQEEYEDDLQVLFVESQGASYDRMASFALAREWLGNRAMWTTEAPLSVGLRGIPHFALLDATGQVVLTGYTLQRKKELEEAIEDLVKERKRGPENFPRSLAKPWKAFVEGEYGEALAGARAAADGAKTDEERAAAESFVATIEARIASDLARAGWLLDNGHPLEGKALVERLGDALEDQPEHAEAVATLAARLETDELRRELAADEDLAKIERKLYEKGPDDRQVKALQKIVEKYPGTKVAERASRLAKIASI